MRLRGRMLATPVLWYRHAGTGRTLILVLNSHVGERDYFRTMRERITELEERGAAVQWEGIRAAPPEAWATATADERAARQVMRTIFRDRPIALARHLGWVYQKDGLPIADSWVNADLNDLELVRDAGADAILAMARDGDKALAKLGSRRGEYLTAMGPLILRRLARPHALLSQAIERFAPDVYAVLVQQRSKTAAAAVGPERDTVMIWGAEHADTIETELAAAGWALEGTRRWLNVGRLPPLTRSLADVFLVACRVGVDTFHAERARLASREIPAQGGLRSGSDQDSPRT
jgi:hypothetical protein